MSRKTDLNPKEMYVCVANGDHYHYDTLSFKRKHWIELMLAFTDYYLQPVIEWKELKRWGYSCVKVKVKIEP